MSTARSDYFSKRVNYSMASARSVPLQSYFTGKQPRDDCLPQCILQWRQGKLLVRLAQDAKQLYLPSLEKERSLVSCLQHSSVRLVCIDVALGEAEIKRWADACEQANKSVFLRGAIAKKMPKPKPNDFSWWANRLIDWIVALLLLIVLSPVMLAIMTLMYVYSPGAIFSLTWHVGERGKLFRVFRFRTKEVTIEGSKTTPLGRWMCRYNLDELPQLFNVLRGEMSLLGSRPLYLYRSRAAQLV